MTRIKLCGMSGEKDILTANELMPEYIGFVFWPRSKRYISSDAAVRLGSLLDPGITAVGVFVDEDIDKVSGLLADGVIAAAQLHGSEDDAYIRRLQDATGRPVIKAFRIKPESDTDMINDCAADLILLDSGAGGGRVLDRSLLTGIKRPYILAGGLSPDNVEDALKELSPYGVDVSSGIETDGAKDTDKMRRFVEKVRCFDNDGGRA